MTETTLIFSNDVYLKTKYTNKDNKDAYTFISENDCNINDDNMLESEYEKKVFNYCKDLVFNNNYSKIYIDTRTDYPPFNALAHICKEFGIDYSVHMEELSTDNDEGYTVICE